MMMISYTNNDKPLVLSWGRTPRLDSGVRVSIHVLSKDVRVYVRIECGQRIIPFDVTDVLFIDLGSPSGLPLSCGSVFWEPSVCLGAFGP
ncbi:hypothetical protein Tco_0043478, partial [Tanacetum coccineum]